MTVGTRLDGYVYVYEGGAPWCSVTADGSSKC